MLFVNFARSNRRNSKALRKKAGFSFTEMSMVLTIAAGVIAVVVSGAGLVKKARLARVVEAVNEVIQAVDQFEDKYEALPGDLSDAGMLPSASPAAVAGNGSGKIDSGEALHFWRHLSIAGLISGTYDGTSSVPGVGVPQAALRNSGLYVYRPQSGDNMSMDALVIEVSGYFGASGYGVITSGEAQSMDSTLDDGNPTTGMLRAADGTGVAAGSCVSSGSYNNTDSEELYCILRFVRGGLNSEGAANSVSCGNLGDKRISNTETCPEGFTRKYKQGAASANLLVGMVETCGADGSWSAAENFCVAVTCSGDKVVGENQTKGCPYGYNGSGYFEECSPEGVWVELHRGCTIDTGPCSTAGQERTLGCLSGDAGHVLQRCTNGNWSTTANTCVAITCGGSSIGTKRTGAGNGAEACDANSAFSGSYTGDVTETCSMDGTWRATSHECVPVYGSCSFPEADTGAGANKRDIGCPPGESGAHIQVCVDAASDYWKMQSNTCAPVQCGDDTVGATRDAEDASCGEGMAGKVIEVCDVNGQWVQDDSQCTDRCSGTLPDGTADTVGNAIWPNAPLGTKVWADCLDGYKGIAHRTCAADGVWADLKTDGDYVARGDCDNRWPAIIENGLVLRLTSAESASVETSGSTVTAWRDKSGHSNHFETVSGNPQRVSVQIRQEESRNVVRFDGNDFIQSGVTHLDHNPEINPRQYTLFVVASHNSSQASQYQSPISSRDIQSSNYGGYVVYRDPWENKWSSWNYVSSTPTGSIKSRTTAGTLVQGELSLLTVLGQDDDVQLFYNGNSGTTVWGADPAGEPDLLGSNDYYSVRVGAGTNGYAGAQHYLYGDIAEIVLYNRVLSDAERKQIENHFGHRWGIEIQTVDCPVANANCRFWIDADDPIGVGTATAAPDRWWYNGYVVYNITDKSGSGSHPMAGDYATGATPTYVWNVLNGKPVLRFDGVNDYMGAYERVLTTAGDDTYTISAVWASHRNDGYHTIWEQNPVSAAVGDRAGINTTNSSTYGFGALGTAFYLAPYTMSAFQVSIVTVNNGTGNIYHNGTQYSGSYNNTTANLKVDRMSIGRSTTNTSASYLFGDIAEIMVFDKVLNSTEVDDLEAYYGTKWGITIN